VIDVTKTVGNSEIFEPKTIQELLFKGVINNVSNLEKAIFSLEYLGQLKRAGLDFVFKGGSAVQVVLADKWSRLSVDVDICSDVSEKELHDILDNVYSTFDKQAFAFKARSRVIEGAVPFYFYIFEAPSITSVGEYRSCLLDVMGAKPNYATMQVALRTPFYESSESITVPTVGALLGDKLSTIGPNTIGRNLVDSGNGVEYAKHFYDIAHLAMMEGSFGFRDCCLAFFEAIKLQSKIRGKDFLVEECCEDLFFTCKVASLSGSVGEQAINRLSSLQQERARSEFRILRDGLNRFRPFLVRGFAYLWDDFRYYAALTALLTKMVQLNLPEQKVAALLSLGVPSKREEIQAIADKLVAVPELERWFIQLEEMINFPKILQTWYTYFTLKTY
jgi:hypothetical protein